LSLFSIRLQLKQSMLWKGASELIELWA
jgi:hypothetical protein